jgi:chromosome segregation ATPase
MTQTNKTFFNVLITALITVFCMYIFMGNSVKTDIAALQQRVKSVQSDEQAIDRKYQTTLKKLQKKNDSLQLLVNAHKVELAKADSETNGLKNEVSQLAAKVEATPDTTKEKASDCDSLAKATTKLIGQFDTAQNICEQTVGELTEQLNNRDSTDSLCNTSYTQIKMTLDTSIAQQQDMTNVIKSLNRKLERKTFESKLMSVTVMLLSGFATTLYLEKH